MPKGCSSLGAAEELSQALKELEEFSQDREGRRGKAIAAYHKLSTAFETEDLYQDVNVYQKINRIGIGLLFLQTPRREKNIRK